MACGGNSRRSWADLVKSGAAVALDVNDLSGAIPPELGGLANLGRELLNLSVNVLSGAIPPELGNLANL